MRKIEALEHAKRKAAKGCSKCGQYTPPLTSPSPGDSGAKENVLKPENNFGGHNYS